MKNFEFIGWVLFTVSACFFVASGVRSGDLPTLVGSLLFLIACFFFIVPLVSAAKNRSVKGEM
ncbi:MAG: hypothetical protein ACI861_001810 [Paracoccaceae bacterium]|jgi:hypothetical protein